MCYVYIYEAKYSRMDQLLKSLKEYGLSSRNFTWSILEYFVSYMVNKYLSVHLTQPAFTCSELTIEILEKGL